MLMVGPLELALTWLELAWFEACCPDPELEVHGAMAPEPARGKPLLPICPNISSSKSALREAPPVDEDPPPPLWPGAPDDFLI